MDTTSINQAMENTLNNEGFTSTAAEALDILLDQVIDDGVLRDIPIVGWMINAAKAAIDVRDRLYIRKLLKFILSTDGASDKERQRFFSELSKHQEAKDRLFEKILMTMERLDDVKKAEYVGKAFMHLVKGDIDILDYYRTCAAIEATMLDDIELFLLKYKSRYGITTPIQKTLDEKDKIRYVELQLKISMKELVYNLMRSGILEERVKLESPSRHNLSSLPEVKKEDKITRAGFILLEMTHHKMGSFKGFKSW